MQNNKNCILSATLFYFIFGRLSFHSTAFSVLPRTTPRSSHTELRLRLLPQRRPKLLLSTMSSAMPHNNHDDDLPPPQIVAPPHPFCNLPGDPSLILVTNVHLGDKKMNVMKAISQAIQKRTGKPESYIAVSIQDQADVIFGGTDDPTALGTLYSIGAISQESNGAITNDVTDLLSEFGVPENRIYINFFDMPRANVGWSRRTFAG